MATYTFTTNSDANISDWLFTNPDGSTDGSTTGIVQTSSNGLWRWLDGPTQSSGVGPATGNNDAGYVYVEASSPGALGQVFTMDTAGTIDLSTQFISFDMFYNHNFTTSSTGDFLLQGWDGTAWVTVQSFVGLTGDSDVWVALPNETFSAFTNADFKIRIHFTIATGTSWNMDFGVDDIVITLSPRNIVIGSTTDSDTANDEINEAAPNGTTVGITALATDPDAGDTVSYSLIDNAGGRFTIDSVTGVVSVLDATLIVYANATSHPITIRSTSSDGSTSDLTVTIQVIDNTPVSIGATVDNNLSTNIVNETDANGTLVNITAYADEPNYGETVSYSLTDDAGGRFTIDSTTGVVTVLDATLIVYANATNHTITVLSTSTDGSTSTANFNIQIEKEQPASLVPTDKFNTIKTTGIIRVQPGAFPDGLNVIGHIIIEALNDFGDLTILSGVLELATAGTYTINDSSIVEVTNTSGGNITINSVNSTFVTNTGPNINILTSNSLEFSGLINGTEVRLYEGTNPATSIEIPTGVETSTGNVSFIHSSGGLNGYARIYAVGYEDIYLKLNPIPSVDSSIPISQRIDRWYKNPA